MKESISDSELIIWIIMSLKTFIGPELLLYVSVCGHHRMTETVFRRSSTSKSIRVSVLTVQNDSICLNRRFAKSRKCWNHAVRCYMLSVDYQTRCNNLAWMYRKIKLSKCGDLSYNLRATTYLIKVVFNVKNILFQCVRNRKNSEPR